MSLHNRIKEARKQKGLTQTELGTLIGVAKTTIAGYERQYEPSAAQLGAIADALDVDVSFLLQDEIKQRHDTQATQQEMENLVKKYRPLDQHGKKAVDAILEIEYKRYLKEMEAAEETAPSLNLLDDRERLAVECFRCLNPGQRDMLLDQMLRLKGPEKATQDSASHQEVDEKPQ